ncbi:MAG TPA: sugar ABC transporter permease [Firmicutes bacterium]|nr:sugar ABC transporter permease [Bacillota bacterium]
MPRYTRREIREWISGYLFLLPSFSIFVVFQVFPIFYAFYISLHEWQLSGASPFVGFANYLELRGDQTFWLSIKNTVLYALMFVPAEVVIALILATFLNSKIKFQGFFKGLYFIPYITSSIIVALVWKWIYNPGFGLLNYLLSLVKLPPRLWLGDTKLALPSIAVMAIWQALGYYITIYLAGLQSIPSGLSEAAEVDGATRFQIFRFITLPLLRPTMLIVVVMATIGSFQVFSSIYVMTSGGPAYATTTIVWYIYRIAFYSYRLGYGAALGFILFGIIFVIALFERRFLGSTVEY